MEMVRKRAVIRRLLSVISHRCVYLAYTWQTSMPGIHTWPIQLLLRHTFNGPFSGTTQVSRYQEGKTNLDFTEARDSQWQWHQLGHMQVCISCQTDNHANTPPLK